MQQYNKKTFVYSFVFVSFIKALDGIEFFGRFPQYFLLLFSVIWGAFFLLYNKKGTFSGKNSILILLFLSVYYIIWSTIFVFPGFDKLDPIHEMVRKLIMLFFVYISCCGVRRYDCSKDIITALYNVLAVYMIMIFILNLSKIDFSKTIGHFWSNSSSDRHRVLFFYAANNVAAELALFVITLSLFLKKAGKQKVLKWFVNFIMMMIIVANNSRGTLICSIIIFLFYCVFFVIRKKKSNRNNLKFCFFTFIFSLFVLSTVMYIIDVNYIELFYILNRYHFLSNIEIVNHLNREMIGLGNFSGGFFMNSIKIGNLYTDYMEMFYASVYVRTGIIGSIYISFVIIYILRKFSNCFHGEKRERNWLWIVLVYMFFMSFFEQYLFSNAYLSQIVFMILFISYLDYPKSYIKERSMKIINTEPSLKAIEKRGVIIGD